MSKLIKKACKTCGNIMMVKPSLIYRKKYCCRSCANNGRKGVHNSPKTEFYKGMRGTRWNGGISKSYGYILIHKPEHPRANNNGYVSQHILVWEETNKRPLPHGWVVHHYNGVRDDNRPENLVGMPKKEHHPALDPQLIKDRLYMVEMELFKVKKEYKELSEKYEKILSQI